MSFESDTIFYTVQEVSQILKISVLTIYKYVKEQKLEAIELGGHYRIEEKALKRFINNHRIPKRKEPFPND